MGSVGKTWWSALSWGVLVSAIGVGCQDPTSTSLTGFGPAQTSTAGDRGTASNTANDDGDDDDDGADDDAAQDGGTGPKLDVASDDMATGGDVGGSGCQKIDFLFVVDNSGSMQDEQQNLINSFPGFMATITDTLEASFFHVMAVSTDNGEGSGSNTSCINGACDCIPAPLCCENACGFGGVTCNGFDCGDLPITECDRAWGTGRQYDASGTYCSIDADRRYMLHTQTDLEGTFGCAANVGTYGSAGEKPMLAMSAALSPENNGAGGCNEGFVRDDALLVVTVITDEEDDNTDPDLPGSPGNPPDWVAGLVQAKGGNPDAIVFLALVGDGNLPDGQCAAGGMPGVGGPGAEDSPRLQAVAQSLPFGVVGSVCAADYTPFFVEAVSVIDASCEIFEPVG